MEKKVALLKTLINDPPDVIGDQRIEDIDTSDGVRYTLAGGDWLLARPSGTEPLVRIYIESVSQRGFSQLKSFALEMVEQV